MGAQTGILRICKVTWVEENRWIQISLKEELVLHRTVTEGFGKYIK